MSFGNNENWLWWSNGMFGHINNTLESSNNLFGQV